MTDIPFSTAYLVPPGACLLKAWFGVVDEYAVMSPGGYVDMIHITCYGRLSE